MSKLWAKLKKRTKIFEENGGSSVVECIWNQSFIVYSFVIQRFPLNRWIIALLCIERRCPHGWNPEEIQCTWTGELKTSCAGFKKSSPKAVSTREHSIWKLRKGKEVTWGEETLLKDSKNTFGFHQYSVNYYLAFLSRLAWGDANLLHGSGSSEWEAQHALAVH